MRIFFAIKIPSFVTQKIYKNSEVFRKDFEQSIKWVRFQHIHLTLKFIRKIEIIDSELIEKQIRDGLRDIDAFPLKITSVGVFPKIKNTRVIWYTFSENQKLTTISHRIDQICVKFGYKREKKPFLPHLTIGRVKSSVSTALRGKIGKAATDEMADLDVDFRVDRVFCIQSQLTSSGPIYKDLYSIALK